MRSFVSPELRPQGLIPMNTLYQSYPGRPGISHHDWHLILNTELMITYHRMVLILISYFYIILKYLLDSVIVKFSRTPILLKKGTHANAFEVFSISPNNFNTSQRLWVHIKREEQKKNPVATVQCKMCLNSFPKLYLIRGSGNRTFSSLGQ